MPHKGTKNHGIEPGDIETLNLEPSFCHDSNHKEFVRIGVLPEDAGKEDGTVSFQLVSYSTEWLCRVVQANLLEDEIDLVVNGLLEAKKRMQAFKELKG